jgi:uncharacterized protein (TIGR03067 family)
MRTVVLIAIAILSTAFAPVPFPKPTSKDELKKLQGEWIGVQRSTVSLQITATHLTYRSTAGGADVAYVLTIDPTKTPKTYDIRMGPEAAPTRFVGIYRLEGDILTLCYSHTRGGRPTSFDVQPQRSGRKRPIWVEVYRRKKP